MFRRFQTLICLLVLSACTSEVSEVHETSGRYYIKPKPAFINDPDIIDWKVGPLRRETLTKGFSFRINLPYIDSEHLQKFIDQYEIDSWVVSVRRRSQGVNRSLEYFYIPLIDEHALRKKGSSLRINQKKYFVVRVYYADAALSTRFENFPCPGLGHNKELGEVEVMERKIPTGNITLTLNRGRFINDKVHRYEVSGNKINGGKTLVGEYYAEIAFYSSKSKKLHSNFYILNNVVKASFEKQKSIKGCSNFKIPKRIDGPEDPVKLFKFKR